MMSEQEKKRLRQLLIGLKVFKLDSRFDAMVDDLATKFDKAEHALASVLIRVKKKPPKRKKKIAKPLPWSKGSAMTAHARTKHVKSKIFGVNNISVPGVQDAEAMDVAFAMTQHLSSTAANLTEFINQLNNWQDHVGEMDFSLSLTAFTKEQVKMVYQNPVVDQSAYPYQLSITTAAKPHFKRSDSRDDRVTTVYQHKFEWYEDLAFSLNHYHAANLGDLPAQFGAVGSTIQLPTTRTGDKYPPAPGSVVANPSTWNQVSVVCRYLADSRLVIVEHFSPENST